MSKALHIFVSHDGMNVVLEVDKMHKSPRNMNTSWIFYFFLLAKTDQI